MKLRDKLQSILANSTHRFDANESAFAARELEHIYSRTYDRKYPELKARMMIPMAMDSAPQGAQTVTYDQWDRVGRAALSAPGATNAPRVDVFKTQFTRPVRIASDSYGYTIWELRSAIMAGAPLNSKKASAARRAIEEILDEVACFGSAEHGIDTGFFNNASVAIEASAGWDSGTTPDAIIAELSTFWGNMVADTQGVERADTLAVPDSVYSHIATTPRTTNSDTTILAFMLQNFPGLNMIEPWYRCVNAGAGGTIDRGVLYRRDPEHVQQDVVSEFEQFPVFQKGQNFEIECAAATAGTAFQYPRSARYIDDI